MKCAALIATLLAVLLLPGVAQAYYVDISITGAGRVYETTDANELDEHCPDAIEGFASPSTTPTGSLGASCRAGSASGDYGWNWVVRYVAEPAAGYRFDRWASDGRTSPGPVLCDGSNGSSTYTGSACQFATAADLQVRAHFVDDTDPGMSTLTGPNQVVSGAATFTFAASADPTVRLLECRVGGVHEWQTCSSGRQENPASSGSYTFQVRALDWSGNRSAESTWNWTVDKTPPETSLVAGPSGVESTGASEFQFNSNESGTFECQIDANAVIAPCTSPRAFTVADGEHTFKVWAKDTAGNVDPTPVTRTWAVDTQAPDTTLAASGPSGSTEATTATFEFGSPDPDATFTCRLDGGAPDACTSPRTYTGVQPGTHTFTVTARDAAGNADATPATRAWTVAAPATTSTSTTPGTPSGGGGPSTNPDPPPVLDTPLFAPAARGRYRVVGARTTVRSLAVKNVPVDAKVLVTCRGKGKGCPFGKRAVKHDGGTISLDKRLEGRRLRAGAVLEVRVTSGRGDVRLARWRIRRGRKPKLTLRCAAPGGSLGRCDQPRR